MIFTTDTGTITKTFNYAFGKISSLVLSGGTPDGIDLTKDFIYVGDNLIDTIYS